MRMMRKTEIMVVDSQPGDGTRYGFTITYCPWDDGWYIGPYKSELNYPKFISLFDVDNVSKGVVVAIASKYESNPWTAAECFRAIKAMLGEKDYVIEGFETRQL